MVVFQLLFHQPCPQMSMLSVDSDPVSSGGGARMDSRKNLDSSILDRFVIEKMFYPHRLPYTALQQDKMLRRSVNGY